MSLVGVTFRDPVGVLGAVHYGLLSGFISSLAITNLLHVLRRALVPLSLRTLTPLSQQLLPACIGEGKGLWSLPPPSFMIEIDLGVFNLV